ncbi:uncharacterized protein LOC117117968 [Anneissia japonica]|uniref:uncharacterized protein LOC117117968 n=1 Tax=Anneissia japonica TaxID=1529436 RepID=UPI001425700C|nr:uncharacterized protein LOC117117968 [Anneissia japonica]
MYKECREEEATKSGEWTPTWKFYWRVHKNLGGRPMVDPIEGTLGESYYLLLGLGLGLDSRKRPALITFIAVRLRTQLLKLLQFFNNNPWLKYQVLCPIHQRLVNGGWKVMKATMTRSFKTRSRHH